MIVTIFAVNWFSLVWPPSCGPHNPPHILTALTDNLWHISCNQSTSVWRMTVGSEAASFIFNHLASSEDLFVLNWIQFYSSLWMPLASLPDHAERLLWVSSFGAQTQSGSLRFSQQAEWKHQKLRASCFHPLLPPLRVFFFLSCIIPEGSLPHCRHVIETQSCSCGRFVNSMIETAEAAVSSDLSSEENLSF